ncbi:MAG: nickel-responsive transcriptional regulator NikR [Armatimonadota bacterium]|jgi:CopG family nickel-responsive transcriptional regulator|nr:nickel-responsive transcriptional regulator NikR [Armatimonadota bacterium]
MSHMERFGVSMPPDLLRQFDAAIETRGYTNRSEAIRDIVRDFLVERRWDSDDAEVIGTITLVYDHHQHDLTEQLTDLQHQFHAAIISTLHVHLDYHHCLEVLVVRGTAGAVRTLANRLLSTRGVKHGKLTATTTGENLA